MVSVAQALSELKITGWVLRGEPLTESDFNEMFRKVTGSDANGSAIESDDTSTWGVTWSQVLAKKDELVAAELMCLLREERNRRLADTDWWAVSDRTMTDDQATYRQALRDIPAKYSSLDDVVWPIKP